MSKLNVFVFPTDDRSGQASVIYHYSKFGHNVFLPKHGRLGLDWSKTATWPALLYKNSAKYKNIDLHGFSRTSENLFGEDYFVSTQSNFEYELDGICCDIIDVSENCPKIDVFHTLRGGERYLGLYHRIAQEYFSDAKWVSSTLNAWDICPNGLQCKNVAKIIPASYENSHQDKNSCNIMCHDAELKLLGVQKSTTRNGFASFNHNFHIRQPQDYKMFCEMNDLLKSNNVQIPNYGGNIRCMGADIRYDGNGPTGNYRTLSPKDCLTLMSSLKAIIHFKQTDWGGGVFFHALNTSTPLITTSRYVHQSNSHNYLINGFNCVIVNDASQAAEAVLKIDSDEKYAERLRNGMQKMHETIFSDQYWKNWCNFLDRLS